MRILSRKRRKTVGENESFVDVLRLAQEDPSFRSTLCAILRQPSFHRKSVLNTMARDMALAGENRNIVQAVFSLADDAVSLRVLELLNEETGQQVSGGDVDTAHAPQN